MARNTSWSGQRRSFPKHIARQILTRAGHRCELRGPNCTGIASEADHHTPWAEGGTDDPSNGQAACAPCHRDKTKAEQARGNARKPKTTRTQEPHPGIR